MAECGWGLSVSQKWCQLLGEGWWGLFDGGHKYWLKTSINNFYTNISEFIGNFLLKNPQKNPKIAKKLSKISVKGSNIF